MHALEQLLNILHTYEDLKKWLTNLRIEFVWFKIKLNPGPLASTFSCYNANQCKYSFPLKLHFDH